MEAFEHDRIVEDLLAALAVEHVGSDEVQVSGRQLRLEGSQLLSHLEVVVAGTIGSVGARAGGAIGSQVHDEHSLIEDEDMM